MHTELERQFNRSGNVLISDQFNNRVVETNTRGDIVWSFGFGPNDFTVSSIIGVKDAERIGDKTLMVGAGLPPKVNSLVPNGVIDNRVILVSRDKQIIWQYGQFGIAGSGNNLLNTPVHCVFVPRGSVTRHRSKSRRRSSSDRKLRRNRRHSSEHKHARRQPSDRRHKYDDSTTERSTSDNSSNRNSNTETSNRSLSSDSRSDTDQDHGNCVLITDQGNNRVILVNNDKRIVWRYPLSNTKTTDRLNVPSSAQLLRNGNYLIADKNNNRAIEVNQRHRIVRTFTANNTLGACSFASRLPNGNTLLTDSGNNRVVEVDRDDTAVWQYITNAESKSATNSVPTRAVRLNNGYTLISDQYNNRVIKINRSNTIIAQYGLPITGGGSSSNGTNVGYNTMSTQMGLYAPHDAKIIGDYTGLTAPN